jgi:predicted nucleotidyltransferase
VPKADISELRAVEAGSQSFCEQNVPAGPSQQMTNDLQKHALRLLSDFAEHFPCIKAVHLFGSVARGSTDDANDIDLFFEYADDMRFSTAQVAAFSNFQAELEQWLLSATRALGKPGKPCCTFYGQCDEDIWQAIKATPPTASLGKAFIVPTPAVEK